MQLMLFILVTLLFIWIPVDCLPANETVRNETVVFPWPGPVDVPINGLFAPIGPVRIVFSDDENIQRQLRIGERVNVILDCTSVLERARQFIIDNNLPMSFLGNISWYAQYYDRDGRLTGVEQPVTEATVGFVTYDIFGENNQFLEADGSVVPTQARIGGTANYRCEICYNETDTCNSSTTFVNVIGDPPVVIIGQPEDFEEIGPTQYQIAFGADICVRRSMGRNGLNIFLFLTCSHNTSFPVNPVPIASYLRNGRSISPFSSRWVSHNLPQLVGSGNTLLIIADYTKNDEFLDVLGNYTCTLRNSFGTSSTNTVITECCEPTHLPNITITNSTGFIDPPVSENTIQIGSSTCLTQGLTIQCTVDTEIFGNVTSIEWTQDGQTVEQSRLTLTSFLTVGSTGVYTCTASNRCGTNSVSSRIVGAPTIDTGSGLIIGNTVKIGQQVCLATDASVNIVCQSLSPTPPPQITYQWTSSSNVIGTGQTLTVNETGTYKCTASNSCGSNQAETIVRRLPSVNIVPTFAGRGGCDKLRTTPPNVDLCPFLGDQLSLECTSNNLPSSSLTLIPLGITSSLNYTSVDISHAGTYTCQATNECGSVNSTVINVQVYDPARIIRDSTLPTPPNTQTVIIGAGRRTTSNNITTGNRVELHCPFTGIEAPMTAWFNTTIDGTMRPINSGTPGISIMPSRDSIVLVITNYDSSFAGRYTCITTNLAGDDSGSVILRNAPTPPVENIFQWHSSSWSNCSKSCGGGERTRSVTCVSITTNSMVDVSQCNALLRPDIFEYCNTDPCCEKDRHSSCKYIQGTDSCNKREYKDVCCCTCSK